MFSWTKNMVTVFTSTDIMFPVQILEKVSKSYIMRNVNGKSLHDFQHTFFTTLLICSIYSLKYPSYLQHCKQLIFKYNSTLVLYYEIKESKRYLWRTILRTFVDNHKAMKLYLIMFMLFNIIYCTDGAAVVKFMIIVRTPMDDIYVFSSIEMYR